MGPRTINERINQLETRLAQVHHELIQRLWERGVKLESGPQAVVRDGSNKCVGLDRQGKKQFLELATAVYQALRADRHLKVLFPSDAPTVEGRTSVLHEVPSNFCSGFFG